MKPREGTNENYSERYFLRTNIFIYLGQVKSAKKRNFFLLILTVFQIPQQNF